MHTGLLELNPLPYPLLGLVLGDRSCLGNRPPFSGSIEYISGGARLIFNGFGLLERLINKDESCSGDFGSSDIEARVKDFDRGLELWMAR